MQPTSVLHVNSLVWINSLRPDEAGATRRVLEDLCPFLDSIVVPYEVFTPNNSVELISFLKGVAVVALQGSRPIIYFDMHGSRSQGLWIASSEEFISWSSLVDVLRQINLATNNNLCVISAACFGLHVINSMTITKAVPFYILIAPENKISFGFVEDRMLKFYKSVFEELDVSNAHSLYLTPEFTLFHCEKMLAVSLTKYVLNHCFGKGGETRRERLLTEAIIERGLPNNRGTRRSLRGQIRDLVKPTEALLQKSADTFLVGRAVGFDMRQLIKMAEKEIAARDKDLARKRKLTNGTSYEKI